MHLANNNIPDAEGIEILKYAQGTTGDIITEVMDTYADTLEQTKGLAQALNGGNDYMTAINIANYLNEFTNYKIDPNGYQWVRTPARLYKDKKGDCKSYSIFINSCLANAGIPHKFRFVSYEKKGDYTHVYPVAIINGVEMPLDVVALQVRGVALGNEINYIKNKDMNGTTRISRLCGIGATDAVSVYESNRAQGKVNQRYLEALIDLESERANITNDPQKLQSIYNKMDFYEAAIAALNMSDRSDYLELIGLLLAKYGEEGRFNQEYATMEERAAALEKTITDLNLDFAKLIQQSVDFQDEFIQRNRPFIEWWKANIVERNEKATETPVVNGIGAAVPVKDIVKAIAPGIMYETQPQDLDTAKARLKQRKHRKLVEYIQSKHPTYTKEDIDTYIRSGVIATFRKEPEEVIDILRSKYAKVAGIGADTLATSSPTEVNPFNTLSESAAGSSVAAAGDWVNAFTVVVDGIAKIGNSVANIMGQVNTLTGANTLQANTAGLQTVIPSVDDWKSSPWVMIGGAAAIGLGAYFLLRPKKRRRR